MDSIKRRRSTDINVAVFVFFGDLRSVSTPDIGSAEFIQIAVKNHEENVHEKGKIVDISEPILPKNEWQIRPNRGGFYTL